MLQPMETIQRKQFKAFGPFKVPRLDKLRFEQNIENAMHKKELRMT
jgi:hypothetical protein